MKVLKLYLQLIIPQKLLLKRARILLLILEFLMKHIEPLVFQLKDKKLLSILDY